MENNKKKHTGSNILIILLILIILASTGVGLYSWAKYRTTVEGTATGEIAKWNFNVTDGNSQTEAIDFTVTRTDNNESVAKDKMAPGTYGIVEIGIDATGTETALTYIIEGEVSNLPTNLKLYSNEERTEEIIIVNNKFSYGGYMSLQEIGKRAEKIYWEWPFETGETAAEKTANNKIDTEDSGKTMNMNITVTGRQVNGEPRLADLVQIGDYVNYDASSNGTYTFANADWQAGSRVLKYEGENAVETTISTNEVFNSEAPAQWRVLSIDRKAGTVDLVAINPTTQIVELSGGDGFVNGETVLKNIGAIYGHGKGASSGRSIKMSDIEQYSSYDKSTYQNDSGLGNYGIKLDFTSGNFYKEKTDSNGNVIGYESNVTVAGTGDSKITMTQTRYHYRPKSYMYSSKIYDLLMNKDYWLASATAGLGDGYVAYYIQKIYVNETGHTVFGSGKLCNSRDQVWTEEANVLPVVTLNTNIQTTGQESNGVWQLDV
ncbi:MAG: hypothetical protein E7313_00940 [Clostridiales bacterium]|nr:hypothetical protein [Clostridiales bacterium]